ncbi:short chain dehydrogenase [Chitinimonas sp.]|uniref:short chain dehydrogenase n=1 Tax=Chitinimonas sp. TaxID=1934313 RepID=UPI0035B33749
MKIAIFGAQGTIGQAISKELGQRHEVIAIGRNSGAHQADMADIASVRTLFQQIGKVDAIIAVAGQVHFGPLADMTPEQLNIGLQSKLMGQANLVLLAREVLNDGGSITLTSGVLTDDPIRFGAAASMANGAIEAFARAAAIELPRGIRVNVVSPTVLQESMDSYGPYFRGFVPVAAAKVAQAYSKSVEGAQTGQVYKVF